MTWQLLLIISIITEAAGRLIQKTLLKDDRSDPIASSIIYQLLSGIIIGIVAFIYGFKMPLIPSLWINFILMPILYGLSNIFIFLSLKSIDASIFTILFTTRVLWVIIAALIILHEVFTVQQFIGTFLILISVVLISFKKQKIQFNKGELYALLAAFIFAFAAINNTYILKHEVDLFSYLSLSFIAPSLFIWICYPKVTPQVIKTFKTSIIFNNILLAGAYSITMVTFFASYELGKNVAQLSSLFQISSVLTVLLAIFILKEKSHVWIKIFAAIISFIGVLLVK